MPVSGGLWGRHRSRKGKDGSKGACSLSGSGLYLPTVSTALGVALSVLWVVPYKQGGPFQLSEKLLYACCNEEQCLGKEGAPGIPTAEFICSTDTD